MKHLIHIIYLGFLVFFLQGCGPLTIITTAITGIMTAQEIEEEYDGDVNYYFNDKVDSTYEYIEKKTGQ
jgi:hypothetical protein